MTVSLSLSRSILSSVSIRFRFDFWLSFSPPPSPPPPHLGPATICFLSHRGRDSLPHSRLGVPGAWNTLMN